MLLSFSCFLNRIGFTFDFHADGLDILYGGNLFGHAILKNNFLVLDLDDCYNNFSSTFCHQF